MIVTYVVSLGAGLGETVQLARRPLIDDDECEAVEGMRIGRGNRNSGRKSATAALCPPQISYDLTCARTLSLWWEASD
jgi:hypothetical protein